MADRSVSVRLRLKISEFEAGANGVKKNLTGLNKKFAETAGFAAGFRKKLEDATKKLPKIEIDANSTPAEVKLAELRAKLEKLSDKEIGVDIDASQALVEMAALQHELEGIGDGATFDVRADIGKALTDLNAVTREVQRLDGQKVEIDIEADRTFADRLRAQVELAARSLPKIQIDADSTPAQAKIAELRARLTAIASKRVGIDVDAGSAMAEIAAIQRELSGLTKSADIDVRVNAGSALAELSAISGEVSRVDGRNANVKVDANVGSALAAIGLVGAALAALPAVTSVAVGVGVLGSAFGAAAVGAAGFAAVAIPSLGRINEALGQTKSAAGGAGGAMKGAAQKAAEAAATALRLAEAQDRVTDSAQKVKDAQRGVKEALTGVKEAQQSVARAQADVAQAVQDASYRHAEALRQVADAERGVQDAQRSALRAQQDLNDARKEAARDAQDLASRMSGAQIDMREATLDVADAEKRLNTVRANPKASAAEIERAQIAYERATQRVSDLTTQIARMNEQQAEFARTGVEGTKRVQDAKESLAAAQQRILDAEQSAADARANVARTDEESARRVADAQRGVADAQKGVAEANQRVLDAQRKVTEAQRDAIRAAQRLKVEQLQAKAAMEAAAKAAGGGGGAASKMAELSKAEKDLAEDIKKFKKEYIDWQRSLQPDVFPAIRSGMDLMSTGMKIATPLVKGSAGAFNGLLKELNADLKGAAWQSFFKDLSAAAPRAIEGLGHAAINVAGGLSGVIQAFLPFTDDLMRFLEDATAGFEKWGRNLKGSPEFEKFVAYVREQGPKVGEVLRNIAEFVGKIFEIGAGAAPGVLDFLVSLSGKLAALDPGQIEAVAKGVGLIFAAMKLGASLKIAGLVLLAEVLGKMSPGQITALATAIGLVVAAVKGYQIFSAVSDALGGFGGGLNKAGKAADGATGKLSGLSGILKGGVIAGSILGIAEAFDQTGDALSGLNPDVAELRKNLLAFAKDGQPASALLDQLGPKVGGMVGSFETFADSAARLAGDNPLAKIADSFTGFIDNTFSIQLDSGRQAIDNLDDQLARLVADGNAEEAAGAFNRLAKQALDAGVPVERLKELFPQYAASMDGIPATTGDVGAAIEILGGHVNGTQQALGEAAQKMNDWKASLDAFNSQTDAASAVREMEKAFNDTKTAIENANGKLEITPGLTAAQRDAVIQARDAFSGYLEKVRASNDAQATLTGRTTDARDAMVKQLPALFDLAGKNGEARDQVLKLAAAYGISETDAHKAARGGQDLLEVLGKLKSKDIHIGADVRPAQQAVDNFITLNSGRKIPLAVYTKNSQLAAGGILQRFEAGGIRAMAGGGMSSAGPPAPNIASTPTVIYAEAGYPEAYVPFDPRYRDRAITILGQVADEFGLEVYNPNAQQKVATLTAGLKATDTSITTSLDDATRQLDSTLGASGTLTTTVASVGTVGQQMSATWAAGATTVSDSVIGVNTAIGISSDMIVKSTDKVGAAALVVADVVAKAAQAILTAASASGGANKGGSQGSVIPPAPGSSNKGGSQGSTNVPAPPGYGSPQNMVAGDYGLYGMTGGPTGASLTNYSQVSAPQQVVVTPAASVPSASGGYSGDSGPAVVIQEQNIYQDADADRFAAQAALRVRARGR